MRTYRYTKTVEAGRITKLVTRYRNFSMTPVLVAVEVGGTEIPVPPDLLARDSSGRRGVGDYLVRYQTGCVTVVPWHVFENGFELVPARPPYAGEFERGGHD